MPIAAKTMTSTWVGGVRWVSGFMKTLRGTPIKIGNKSW